jgi:hypothetical protein
MTWILYIIFGVSNPSLQQTAQYSAEEICRQATKELATQNVRAVCLPREKSK